MNRGCIHQHKFQMQRMQFRVCLETQLLDTTKKFEMGQESLQDPKYLSNVNSAILDSSKRTEAKLCNIRLVQNNNKMTHMT